MSQCSDKCRSIQDAYSSKDSCPVNSSILLQPSKQPTTAINNLVVLLQVSQSIIGINYNDFNTPTKVTSNGRLITVGVVNTLNHANGWTLSASDVNLDQVSSTTRRKLVDGISIAYTTTVRGVAPDDAKTAIQNTMADTSSFVSNLQKAYISLVPPYQGFINFTSLSVSQPTIVITYVSIPKPTLQPVQPSTEESAPTTDKIGLSVGLSVAGLFIIGIALYYYYIRIPGRAIKNKVYAASDDDLMDSIIKQKPTTIISILDDSIEDNTPSYRKSTRKVFVEPIDQGHVNILRAGGRVSPS